MGKHLPVVQADAVYEQSYAARKAIADAERAELEAAIAECGAGVDAYGKHMIHDKLGIEPTRVIYCCRRNGSNEWTPAAPDLSDCRIIQRTANLVTPSGARYTSSAVTMEKPSSFAPYPVTRFLFRYDCGTVVLAADYRPRTPAQMKAAAEARRAKALAELEREELERKRAAAEREARQPSLPF